MSKTELVIHSANFGVYLLLEFIENYELK